MPLRLLLILTICLQQLSLAAVVAAATDDCQDPMCCQVTEYTTCCGELITEMRCGRTGDSECRCGIQPGDTTPAPPLAPAPRSGEQNDLGVNVAVDGACVIERPTAAAQLRRRVDATVHRSHNEVRALLCIWRT